MYMLTLLDFDLVTRCTYADNFFFAKIKNSFIADVGETLFDQDWSITLLCERRRNPH